MSVVHNSKAYQFCSKDSYRRQKAQTHHPALKYLNWSRIESLVVCRDVTKVYKALRIDDAPPEIRELFTPRAALLAPVARVREGNACHREWLSAPTKTPAYLEPMHLLVQGCCELEPTQ